MRDMLILEVLVAMCLVMSSVLAAMWAFLCKFKWDLDTKAQAAARFMYSAIFSFMLPASLASVLWMDGW